MLGVVSGLAQVHHFAVSRDGGGLLPDTTAGIPLFLQVVAQDSVDGTVASFAGTVDISSTGTLATGAGTTAAFASGVLTGHQITFSGAGTATVTATESGGSATGTSNTFTVLNPAPALTGISPAIKTTGETGFTLTVSGHDFVPSSEVLFDALSLVTTFVDTTTVTAAVPASAIDTAGTFAVTVATPGPAGGTSSAQDFVVAPPVVDAKVYLEGADNGTAMTTTLRNDGLLPLAQPYGAAPWSFAGAEQVASIPAGVVDWVLLELRTGTGSATRVERRAAFLLSGGAIVDTGGTGPVAFPATPAGSYRIVVYHRNHLALMSASAVSLDRASALYDFSASASASFGGAAKTLPGGRWGMYAGDYSRDGFIDAADFIGPDNDLFLGGYRPSDVNMDGFVDASDFLFPDNNVFIGTSVP